MVVATRRVFGMDWRYGIDCQTSNHASVEVSAEQSVRLRDPSVIVVPTLASHQSLQDALDTFFATGSGSDLAFGNAASPCPYCAESLHENLCQWRVSPWRADIAPDGFFLVVSGTGATVVVVFFDLCLRSCLGDTRGHPTNASLSIPALSNILVRDISKYSGTLP